ncbi:bifunctional diaminohydroxyphosphoribosylaminopyrimidine deaminase/5-amino-6-(5-phosphoribosylamino)uracil reductase RibD [Adhaeribacter radiodurans]|uniref:Riboflavin biosynthesis protein RibD n=1 Tax=Adhaeribacter radiodurans TaxID=2745197 RepID=A0A7L7LFF4_9BACT|nr:bifunctional diaminohydroxyphosphoribosylaminopyrimidine deaminase/5-amino-6-(5-phosphoribosylamino)uracil reductase RibD [Adhaeribacter radiodurans]QMU31245.1 bifunctional diaminohydroxyphosphoribosylaminopyrimidine deaminase/5-amino-6-(5-phosphoribosylamino)uracil reductase RibD [Adhaeribacter radiodurans]
MRFADELYMRRALELAALGHNTTRPNPMVGCVVTYKGKIIGEGCHQQYGGPHAEVNAINSLADKSLLPQCKVYVTLEPCSHYGKTPPCADFLIEHGVRSIFICNTDPNPLVAGRGIRKLLDAGCEVHVGLLEEEGSELNKRFFTFHRHKRPYIVLKWAQTADGFIAQSNGEPTAISGSLAKKLVHKWRTEEQAIMVGTRTALSDNPHLNVREWTGNAPIRIVIDKNLRLPPTLHVFDKKQPTFVYNYERHENTPNLEYVKITPAVDLLEQILPDLHQRSIQSVLVEGGTILLNHFLASDIWDEIRVLRSPQQLENGVKAPSLPLTGLTQTATIGDDELFIYRKYQ